MKQLKADLPLHTQRLTAAIDTAGEGIEYGPLHRPILPRALARKIRYVDYADRNFLVKKYKDDAGVNTDAIPKIDIVSEGRLIDVFVSPDTLDFVLASHVAEHVPDLIGWLEANYKVLRRGGHIACAFPDRRYTFDLARQPTRLADVVAAHLEGRTRPSLPHIATHLIEARDGRAPDIWSGKLTAENSKPKRDIDQALGQLRRFAGSDDYYDVHCWVFSDVEFVSVISGICDRILPSLRIISFFPSRPFTNEFMWDCQLIFA